ncbi:MAG: BMC domain-containing protein [Candidatus Delongbacteria bacterium]|nr:BMC domain-containing protein [Candidatus Delongbacteria bacterium]
MKTSIGIIEFTSIASGIAASDAMLKAADVTLLISRTICPGKFMTMISGDVAAVRSSIEAAEQLATSEVVDTFIVANIHPTIIPAIQGINIVDKIDALGIIESFSVASLVEAADQAVKTAKVQILELRLAMAIGGKGFVTLCGEVAAVTSAVNTGAGFISQKGLLVNKVVIPHPRAEILKEYL